LFLAHLLLKFAHNGNESLKSHVPILSGNANGGSNDGSPRGFGVASVESNLDSGQRALAGMAIGRLLGGWNQVGGGNF